MPSRLPNVCPSAPTPESCERTYEVRTVTPVFGGGATAGIADPLYPVRATAILGSLRRWWRATKGRKFDDVARLREAEARIWGGAGMAAKIRVRVTLVLVAQEITRAQLTTPEFRNLNYVLFGFGLGLEGDERGDEMPRSNSDVIGFGSLSFNLHFTVESSLVGDLEAAMWAWTNFGGLGSRTRRGCGSLYCKAFAPGDHSSPVLRQWFQDGIKEHCSPKAAKGPVSSGYVDVPPFANLQPLKPMQAWTKVIEDFAYFRQGEGLGRPTRVPNSDHPGRSYWPEADTLRARTGYADLAHRRSVTVTQPTLQTLVPRSQFGLPLQIKFQAPNCIEDRKNECTIYPQGSDRMASPLIVKPLAFGDGTYAVRIALVSVAASTNPSELRICFLDEHEAAKESIRAKRGPTVVAGSSDDLRYANSPVKRFVKRDGPLKAFVTYLVKDKSYQFLELQ